MTHLLVEPTIYILCKMLTCALKTHVKNSTNRNYVLEIVFFFLTKINDIHSFKLIKYIHTTQIR